MSKSQPLLLDVPREAERSSRAILKAKIEALKSRSGIWTHSSGVKHRAKDWYPWLAMYVPEPGSCGEGIDYNNPFDIFAKYGARLEEAGMVDYGLTEREAIIAVCKNMEIPCDL